MFEVRASRGAGAEVLADGSVYTRVFVTPQIDRKFDQAGLVSVLGEVLKRFPFFAEYFLDVNREYQHVLRKVVESDDESLLEDMDEELEAASEALIRLVDSHLLV